MLCAVRLNCPAVFDDIEISFDAFRMMCLGDGFHCIVSERSGLGAKLSFEVNKSFQKLYSASLTLLLSQ